MRVPNAKNMAKRSFHKQKAFGLLGSDAKTRASSRHSPYVARKKGARLGQHFLTGQWAARVLARSVGVRPHETIVEIGPGKGALTRELLALGPVVAIEKDQMLVDVLRKSFVEDTASGKLKLVREDIRNIASETLGLEHYVIAANIPYYITGEIIRQFLTAKHQPRAMALLIQKEVAERILARDGKESILSLSVKAYGTPKIIAKVSRGNFSPPPTVESTVLLVENISRDRFGAGEEQSFFKAVRAGFASKRKFLSSNLSGVFDKRSVVAAFTACGIPEKIRAEDLTLARWFELSRRLYAARPL